MSTENELQIEDVVEVPEFTPTVDDQGNDTTDWKALAEANRELALKNQGIANRFKTKAERLKEKVAEPILQKGQTKSDELDYGQLAYLAANDIKSDDEIEFAQNVAKETGKDLKSVLGSKYFQAELAEMRESKATANAVPKGTKRSNTSSIDDVDYWIAKDELPPESPENRDLRAKIVNEKIKREKNASPFAGARKLIIK